MNIEQFHSKNLLLLDEMRQKEVQVPPIIIISTRDAIHMMEMQFINDEIKAYEYDIAALILKKVDGRFYSLFTEAWMVQTKDPDIEVRPSEHKDRKTVYICFTCSKNKTLSSAFIDDNTIDNFEKADIFSGVATKLYTRKINSKFEEAFNQAWDIVKPPYYYETTEDELYKEVETKQ